MSWEQDEALRCVKCGFCLQACPTYQEWGIETHSPRGRLSVMRSLMAGELTPQEAMPAIDHCLGCRACEPACPSGIEYGRVLEGARHQLVQAGAETGPRLPRLAVSMGLRHLLPHPARLRALASGLRLLRRTGLVRSFKRLLPAHMERVLTALPEPPERGERERWLTSAGGRRLPTGEVVFPAIGTSRYRVAFLTGCVMDALFWAVNRSTVTVLQRIGCDVVVPAASCCGALHAHAGQMEQAAALARENLRALAAAEAYVGTVDAIVTNSGGCGAHMVGYSHLLGSEAEPFVKRVMDLSQWVDKVGLGEAVFTPLLLRVTYQESCHLANGQKVRKEPRRLLAAIPGVHLIEMAEAGTCCGSAGIYNLTHPEMAGQLLSRKVGHITGTMAEVVVTANPGCHLQLLTGLQDAPNQVQVMHLAEVLAKSLAPGR